MKYGYKSSKIYKYVIIILGGVIIRKILLVFILCIGFSCNIYAEVLNTQFKKEEMLNKIYSDGDYTIYESKLIDMYFIACALYFDFQSSELLPNSDKYELYKNTKEYFMPYKNHEFIKNFEKYVDLQYKTKKDGVTFPLIMYAFSKTNYDMEIDNVQTDVFSNSDEFNLFVKELYDFYKYTDADKFFNSQQNQKEMKKYIQENIKNEPVSRLIQSMKDYVGNTDKNTKYCSIMTLYRPFNASFFNIHMDDTLYMVGQQSPNDVSLNPEAFDIS